MDLLKTPSVQSLLDSDIESIASFHSLDIEELDEAEYALPPSEAPTLAEVLQNYDDDAFAPENCTPEPMSCAVLQVELLQAVSQQLLHAQERTSTGAATSLGVGIDGRLTVGTAHGRLLTFQDQVLRWVCDTNSDRGAVSCLAYNKDGTRILVGYARGLVCQYESSSGLILRRVVLGGELWGVLQVTWGGITGLALDTGGSVWLMKFSRPLGVRSARASCLFSGARGEVVAMAARDARVLALATLSRVIVVAGGRAAGLRFGGPANILPVLTWSENDDRTLICARATSMQWLQVTITGITILLRPIQKVQLKTSPLWLGWLGDELAIFDSNEHLFLWQNNMDKPLDLSDIEPVYASAFFKGLWTDGRVSRAMCSAGASALGGACVGDGVLSLLGRRGVVRVRQRDLLARSRALFASNRRAQAISLLCSIRGADAINLAKEYIVYVCDRPYILSDKDVAQKIIKLCVAFDLREELWNQLWDQCWNENAFVEALSDAAARGELEDIPPSPDLAQVLIERLAEFAPELVERVVSSLPLTSIDPHRASVFARDMGLWRAVGALAATLGGSSGAMRELCVHVRSCRAAGEDTCQCAGDALLLAAADGLAGRAVGGRMLPDHARPSARHDALQALLTPLSDTSHAPLRVLLRHDARSLVRLLEQSARDPPFVGPLGKQNRLRVARALLMWTDDLKPEDKVDILEFITEQLSSGALPTDQELICGMHEIAMSITGLRADRAWLALLRHLPTRGDLCAHLSAAHDRPRVAWHIHALTKEHDKALQTFLNITDPNETDLDELFEYLNIVLKEADNRSLLKQYFPPITELRPRAASIILLEHCPELLPTVLESISDEAAFKFTEYLLEVGRLSGDVALKYLRHLCKLKPHDVAPFLNTNAGIVRPEDALLIVRELGPRIAEPHCLEAAGDFEGALEVLITLYIQNKNEDSRSNLIKEACQLCTRVGPTVPAANATKMWTRLLEVAKSIPATLLLDAIVYVPVDSLIERMCDSAQMTSTVLECASSRLRLWQCGMRVTGREMHARLARSLRDAGRGRGAGGRCASCGAPLMASADAVRLCECGTAQHATCDPGSNCATCLKSLPALSLIPHKSNSNLLSPLSHNLLLVAPPRPDLEGIV